MLAKLVLLAFIPFAFWVFKRLPGSQAAAVVVLTGSLMIPERVAIDLPLIPPMDKEYVTYLSALLAAYTYRRSAMARARPFRGLELAIVLMTFGNIATASMNPDPMMDEGRLEDGLGLYWLIAQAADDLLTIAVPYLVGRALFTSLDDLYVFMGTLVIAAVGYTGLITLETVMSLPFRVWHLAQIVYGLPGQPLDRGGFTQPMVFFDNGLALASFMAVALIGCSALVKAKLDLPLGKRSWVPRLKVTRARHVLTVGLLMTLNVAGNVYGATFLAAYIFLRPRLIALIAISLTTLAVVYPALRIADVFPHKDIVAFAAEYDEYRADSLRGRFDEEEHVLGNIGNRLWVGWGTYARIPGAETFGQGEAGLDGWWTIRLGSAGVIGVLLYYGMLAIPVYRGWFALGRMPKAGAILVGSLLCMISIRMIDLIINGWWNCLPVFLAGVVSGVIRGHARNA